MKNSVIQIILTIAIFLSAYGNLFAENPLHYYGQDSYLIEGIAFKDSVRENSFDRLPLSAKGKVREAVWKLSKNSAGVTVRFLTNSSRIAVRWNLLTGMTMDHMAATGISGVDLYGKVRNRWQYINTGRPHKLINEAILVENMTSAWNEYLLYLPLYDGIADLQIGVDSLAEIRRPAPVSTKPAVFYGTSITQGGCASRPGMAYTNILGRKTGIPALNFGFSGNGKMEKEVVDLIAEIDAAFFVIDCIPNMSGEDIRQRTIPLVETIRKKHPSVPVVFVEGPLYKKAFFDSIQMTLLTEKNKELQDSYKKMTKSGVKNLYYISSEFSIKNDHEGSVDSVHLTDLGFMRFSDYLVSKLKKFKLITGYKGISE